jgi:uncharacterized protein
MNRAALLLVTTLTLSACGGGGGRHDNRVVDRDETLLSVSATGRSETRPDMASFSAGIETFGKSGPDASKANEEKMNRLVAALEAKGITDKDIQTQSISIQRIDWGAKKGLYQASNQVSVRVRKVDQASATIGAATGAGANILSGPTLSQSDPEKGKLSAYGNAYKAAKAHAEAYAEAAGMRVARVLTIRDGGASGAPSPYEYANEAADAAAVPTAAAPPIRIGTDINEVSVSVDFALEAK